jgi:uncharacterized protein YecE (DUF72 family)
MTHPIRVGVGGWQFDEWRKTFYPETLPKTAELKYASRKFTAVEVNATYYSTFKPSTFLNWAAQVPEDFVFSLKAHRFSTVRKTKEDMKTSIDAFLGQGLTALKHRLGPINWQFPGHRKFDRDYFQMFLSQLPKEKDKIPLRHALEVRGSGFDDPAFFELLDKHGATVVYAEDDEFPKVRHEGSSFAVARFMQSKADEPNGYDRAGIDRIAKLASGWAKKQDVFVFFISGAKERNPLAALALQDKLGITPPTSAEADALAAGKARAAPKPAPKIAPKAAPKSAKSAAKAPAKKK